MKHPHVCLTQTSCPSSIPLFTLDDFQYLWYFLFYWLSILLFCYFVISVLRKSYFNFGLQLLSINTTCMKSVFILAYLATICWLMWIIQSPTSSLFPAPCLVLERDLSCSTSLSYRPVSSFIQLYLYRLLAATNSGSLLPFDYTWILLSQTEPT